MLKFQTIFAISIIHISCAGINPIKPTKGEGNSDNSLQRPGVIKWKEAQDKSLERLILNDLENKKDVSHNSSETLVINESTELRKLEESDLEVEDKIVEEMADQSEEQEDVVSSSEGEEFSEGEGEGEDSESIALDSSEIPLGKKIDEMAQNPRVQKWIDYFTKKESERFQRFLDRGHRYRSVVEDILVENGLPKELYYLAMIESGYVTYAKSHASAVGTWQFIKGTGKNYGLMINPEVDERRDPIRATEAAARYLMELYHGFESWELALAAYNCGEYRVLRALMKNKDRDYWSLVDKRALPTETQDYVPKFIAAVIVGSRPEEFGLKSPTDEIQGYPEVELKTVPGGVSLSKLGKKLGVDPDILTVINPHLLRKRTPANTRDYELWLPKGTVSERELVELKKSAPAVVRIVSEDQGNKYVVRRGDSLYKIAKRYRTTVSFLKRENRLSTGKVFPGQVLTVKSTHYEPREKSKMYLVKKGDTLFDISKKFGISTHEIKKKNNIRGQVIKVGQRLTLF